MRESANPLLPGLLEQVAPLLRRLLHLDEVEVELEAAGPGPAASGPAASVTQTP